MNKQELLEYGIQFWDNNKLFPKRQDMVKESFGADYKEVIETFGSMDEYYKSLKQELSEKRS